MIRNYLRSLYRALIPLLYGHTQFKLFLNESIVSINGRLGQLAAASDYFANSVRPIPITAPFGKSMLVIAPHQDDEAIGCGGALALQVRAGQAAHVVLVHDGADGCEDLGMTRAQLTALRNQESVRAAALLGLEEPTFLNHANLVADADKIVEKLRAIIADRRVDVILTPFMLDAHPDHRTIAALLARALPGIDRRVRLLCYEVWGFCIPNVIVVIDDVIEKKLAMLRCFEFANKALDYVGSTKGVNMYRSRLLGAGMCQYAECYFEIPSGEYIELIGKIQNSTNSIPWTTV